MFVNTFLKRCIFILISILISLFLLFYFFGNILFTDTIIISYSVHPFNPCYKYPIFWYYFKIIYIVFYFLSTCICSNTIYSLIFKKTKKNNKPPININENTLSIFVGYNDLQEKIYIPEKGLYQNILVTGTIGSGKTSSALYPFTEQLINYKCNIKNEKLGFLILDVKGNYYKKVKEYAEKYNRENDLKIIEIGRRN